MKKTTTNSILACIALLGSMLLSISCKKDINAVTRNSQEVTTTSRAVTYTLIWADEFNGTSVNTANWNIINGNPGVNNEKEFYQPANVTVTGGNLVITARQQTVQGQPYT